MNIVSPLLQIKISLRRALKDFGVKYGFNDREAEQGIVEFKQRKDPNFNVKKHEQDIGLQAFVGSLTGFSEKASQTIWDRKVNASVQTSTKAIGEDTPSEKKEAMKKAEEARKNARLFGCGASTSGIRSESK